MDSSNSDQTDYSDLDISDYSDKEYCFSHIDDSDHDNSDFNINRKNTRNENSYLDYSDNSETDSSEYDSSENDNSDSDSSDNWISKSNGHVISKSNSGWSVADFISDPRKYSKDEKAASVVEILLFLAFYLLFATYLGPTNVPVFHVS